MSSLSALTATVVGMLLLAGCTAARETSSEPPPTPATPADRETATAATPTRAAPPPSGAEAEFSTDFSRHTVDYAEILSGGPPKDGIPSVDDPQFISVEEAGSWLQAQEPVILLRIGEDARAYPLQILVWHEIINDVVDNVPVLVTFCPLCNTAIAFERTVDDRVLDFGTTGRLRYSNLIMYDRQTETWWQQANGEAIAGELTGTRLGFLPAAIVSWEDFKSAHPNGMVLSTDTGYTRPYGQNPYVGYDDVNNTPFLYRGPETPTALRPMTRVLAVELNGDVVAFPYDLLEELRVVNETIGGKDVVVLWNPGTASALDSSGIAFGRDVGAANAFSRMVDGMSLTFAGDASGFVDEETGSTWNILGEGIEGPMAGRRLDPIVAINHFWFSWVAFQPETWVYRP